MNPPDHLRVKLKEKLLTQNCNCMYNATYLGEASIGTSDTLYVAGRLSSQHNHVNVMYEFVLILRTIS